jgi:hypothetical protein
MLSVVCLHGLMTNVCRHDIFQNFLQTMSDFKIWLRGTTHVFVSSRSARHELFLCSFNKPIARPIISYPFAHVPVISFGIRRRKTIGLFWLAHKTGLLIIIKLVVEHHVQHLT